MLTTSVLTKKRDGGTLSDEEIRFLVDGFCRDEVADYQMSAFAMAVCIRGMTRQETTSLTHAMWRSGRSAPRHGELPRVDKHSTGGLGDKVSLILAPLLAACDVHVPMISGRGLGLTGGTLDKLEAIPGFRTDWSIDDAERLLDVAGAYIVSASPEIAPADRRLYALRDVTGTVESVPLITASILSKKLSASLDALVMDVKVGSGAFMKSIEEARSLAESIVAVGTAAGLPTRAILSDMSQPLGEAVGNAIEVNESVEVLQNTGPIDVRELTIELCADVLVAVGRADSVDQARQLLDGKLRDGSAYERFERLVSAQHGKLRGPLPVAKATEMVATEDGYVGDIDCRILGETVVALGGGRRRVGDTIDPAVGIKTHIKIGEKVSRGDRVLTLCAPVDRASDYLVKLEQAIRWTDGPISRNPLIIDRLCTYPNPAESNALPSS